jgi:hypothetical protein
MEKRYGTYPIDIVVYKRIVCSALLGGQDRG